MVFCTEILTHMHTCIHTYTTLGGGSGDCDGDVSDDGDGSGNGDGSGE